MFTLGKAPNASFSRSFHGRLEIEESSLLDEPREALPKFLFDCEPLAMEGRKIARCTYAFEIGKPRRPVPCGLKINMLQHTMLDLLSDGFGHGATPPHGGESKRSWRRPASRARTPCREGYDIRSA
jgi:hypothetical protein